MESEGVTRAWKEVMPDDHRGDWWLSVRVERHGTALAKCQGGEAAQPKTTDAVVAIPWPRLQIEASHGATASSEQEQVGVVA